MNMRHDLLIWRADSEDCCKDKKKIEESFDEIKEIFKLCL